MDILQPTGINDERESLYFWAFGDLHYRNLALWNEVHAQRLAFMFQDLHEIWEEEGAPAFCVSPGDLVEKGTGENHRLARTDLETQLGAIPFYPGIGNHEFDPVEGQDPLRLAEIYTTAWEKPLRYTWTAEGVICIMLDYPDPHTLADSDHIFISQDTLAFLDLTLTEQPANPAIIFLHCPLRNTVLDRDPQRHRDFNSLQSFFSPENSQEVRDILARHSSACLYFSGHTHSGWEAPNLVCTEYPGGHPVTFVNLMSPWYTGRNTGLRLSEDQTKVTYIPDDPDVIPTFAVRIYRDQAIIQVREHRTKQWLKKWVVPLQ